LLDAIEAGLPDSQFAPDTAMALDRLAKLMENSHRNDLAKYLEHSKRLSGVTTTMARNSFRSLIRLCLELVDQNPKETPGLAELRAEYLDHQRAESGRREQALKNGDFELLRKVGHDLKGTATSYGFAELTEIGRALETAAKENNAVAVDVLLERILSYLAIVWPSPEDRQDAERF
jgi:HPt (histidine-containing phosphotransfer) domain-containing protein